MPAPYTGGCQCGAVRYEITDEPKTIYRCYCKDCQKQSGSAHSMSMITPAEFFKLVKGELKTFEMEAESGNPKTGYFCPDCGTRIYNARSSGPGWIVLKPGTLDDTSWVTPVGNLWTRSASDCVTFAEDEAKFETQPSSFEEMIDAYPKANAG